jgi:Methyltransferase domain
MSAIYTANYFNRPTIEKKYFDQGKLREDEELILRYMPEKAKALSVGCGKGWLEHLLTVKGCEVTAVDVFDFRLFKDFKYCLGGMDAIPEDEFTAIYFCESLEHIHETEFDRNWPRLLATLKRNSGRFLVANWESYHPLLPNGWDHIRTVDDALYDRFEREAKKTVYRKGSHLVLDF